MYGLVQQPVGCELLLSSHNACLVVLHQLSLTLVVLSCIPMLQGTPCMCLVNAGRCGIAQMLNSAVLAHPLELVSSVEVCHLAPSEQANL